MLFCGQFGQQHRMLLSQGVNKIELAKGVYDELLLEDISEANSSEIRTPSSTFPDNWTKYTSLWSHFNGSLYCGNLNYGIKEVKSIIIKRRKHNSIQDGWLPLFQIDINGNEENFNFNIYDKYVRANEEYDYVLVPVLQQGTEGIMVEAIYPNKETVVKFDGLHIVNAGNSFSTPLQVELSTEKNKPTSIQNPIGTKYPYVITTSENNYYTGNVSAVFVKNEIVNNCRKFYFD